MLALFCFMRLERNSPCKVNLILNVLGKRPDGFHELETVLQPISVCDTLTFERLGPPTIELTCSEPSLATDASNLVHRAATRFFELTAIHEGVRIHLEKRIPLAAGLGGGSGNAATTLLALNDVFSRPLTPEQLHDVAASLGSDVPFFLQSQPALALGRGERIQPLPAFAVLRRAFMLLIYPGFGISTAWTYENLARFPEALNGRPGRAERLVALLGKSSVSAAAREFYNSLEAPVLQKYPVLALFQEMLRQHGAAATLMSGSGSTTFALFENQAVAEDAVPRFKEKFGARCWTAIVPLT